MKTRSGSLILSGLLLLAGIWFFWPAAPNRAVQKTAVPAVSSTVTTTRAASTAPLLFGAGNAATNSAPKTNAFAWRLTNTQKSLAQLMSDPHAILLENALLDTRMALNLSIPKNLQAQGDPGAYIVQASGPITSAFRAALAAAGAQVVSYIPNNAYLVTTTAGGAAGLAGRPGVQSVIPYEPYYKLPASLMPWAGKVFPADRQLRVAAYANTADAAEAWLTHSGAQILAQDTSPFGKTFIVQNVTDVAALVQQSVIQRAEPAYRRAVANDLARVTLGISADTITPTNYLNLYGSNVVVEVNDTGIDATHPDFSTGGNPTTAGGAPIRVIGNSALSLVDTNGHGTHVAGIIAGNGSKSYSVATTPQGSVTNADFRGKAPAAKLYSVVAQDNSDYYLQTAPALTNALISNNSWTYVGDSTYDLAAASYDAAVRDALPTVTGSQPVLFVFAAGNEGGGGDDGQSGNPDTITSPGTAKDVITVGALQQDRSITNTYTPLGTTNPVEAWFNGTSSSYLVAGYSSCGNVGIGTEGTYGRFKPDVVAPGSFVVSTRSSEWDQNAYYNPTNDNFTLIPDFVSPLSVSQPSDASFTVYPNAAVVTIQLEPIATATTPLTNNLSIYVWPGTDPFTAAPIIFANTNFVLLPAVPNNTSWSCAISNPNNSTISYNMVVDVLTTNDMGDYFTVLSNLNESIGPWYRYESGTSMAAPAVSGTLALIQDYFTNTLHATPSPALLKAMLINGSRSLSPYYFTVTNNVNFQGWGLPNIQSSVPPGLTNVLTAACSTFFLDQSPTNALATGDQQSFLVSVPTNSSSAALALPLRVTLAWTDPPGNPAAAIKLVNNLILMVSNNVTGDVYFGNDIPPFSTVNEMWNTNTAPNLDTVNNVENIFLPSSAAGSYTVTVLGYSVNVNAVTAQTNNTVQDYALVIACGEGEVTNAITVTAKPFVSNPTGDQDITVVGINGNGMATNTDAIGGVFFNQLAGANTPLLGTNTVSDVSTNYASTAVVTVGMTNQWHFYVVQNTTASGTNAAFTNAAFVTFLQDTLSMPRMGVNADPAQNPTTPEADVDMYVSTDPSLTNLNPVVLSNCVNGTQIGVSAAGVFNGASLGGGGSEFVVDTGSQAGQTYYIGVKSETAIAAEYGFLPVFSQQPFSEMKNGNEIVNGLLLPMNIPDGSNKHPGKAYIFALAIQPIVVQDVIVSDTIVHQNFGDLIGTLSHNNIGVVLNNHEVLGNPPGPYTFTYDDSPSPIAGSQPPDGPGSLLSFQGQQGVGPWILTEVDDAPGNTGYVTNNPNFTVTITPHLDLTAGIYTLIPGHGYFYGYVDVPVGATNLTISATNVSGTIAPDGENFIGIPLDAPPYGILYEKLGEQPVPPQPITNADQSITLNNPGPFGPGGSIYVTPYDVPPIEPGRYYVTLYNASPTAQEYFIIAHIGIGKVQPVDFTPVGPVPLLDDAVSYAYITNYPGLGATNETIASIAVGLRVEHPRISDLVFTLISPDGTRYLLMQNRGGTSTNGAGATIVSTNDFQPVSFTGGPNPVTNIVNVGQTAGTVAIDYDFFTLPDQMTVYYQGGLVFDSGIIAGSGTFHVSYGPGIATNLTIVMNQFTNSQPTTQWSYTVHSIQTNFYYLTFTDDTNITTPPISSPMIPIKFAPTPFVPGGSAASANLVVNGSFESPSIAPSSLSANVTGGYFPGWTIASGNMDLLTAAYWQPAAGNQSIDLNGNTPGTIYQDIQTVAGQVYNLRFAHAANPGGATPNLAMSVFWRGALATNAPFFHAGTTVTSMGWQYVTLTVIGSGGLDRLEFEDLNGEADGAGPTLDDVSLTPVITPDNLYYQPEQDLTPLVGTSAYGLWTLEIQDDRVGATNNCVLDSWQLSFVFANTNPAPAVLFPGTEICTTTPTAASDILWYQVNVPLNVLYATNTLFSADLPVNLLYNPASPSTNGASVLLTNKTSGISILSTTNGTPLLIPGSTYYLGVQNLNSVPVNSCIGLDFDLSGTPFAYTEPAQLVTGTSAQLNGFATPNGYAATAWFQWGTNTLYGSNTPAIPVGNGFSVVYVTNSIPTVTNVPYHFRLVVNNSQGVTYGFDQILDEANVVAWGANYDGQITVPTNKNVTAIAGAYDHNLALTTNGQMLAWGDNTFKQATVPAGLSNAVTLAVAGGQSYSMALQSNGIVASWGVNLLSQTNVPAGLNNVVTIAGGTATSLALQNTGTVVAWGANFFGLTNVPVGASNTVAIAGGTYHALALKNDGTVTAWGDDSVGETDVPTNLNSVVAIAAGGYHSLALKADGTVVAWGDNSVNQTNVPVGLTNVAAIAAGGFHNLALKSDGTLVTWGDNSAEQLNVPFGLTNFVAIAAGYLHSLALTPQSSPTNVIIDLVPGGPQTGNILPGEIIYYRVSVPINADFATNRLLSADAPLNVWFTTNNPPAIASNATLLFAAATNGVAVLSTNSAPTNIIPGKIYYLGLQNTNSSTVSYAIEVDFHLTTPANVITMFSIIHTNINGTNGFLLTWFAPSNDLFQVQWTGTLNLPVTWTPFTNPPAVSYNTNFPATATSAQFNFFDDGTQTGGFGPMRFYRLKLLLSPANTLTFIAPSNQVVSPGASFTVTNTATDSNPAAVLTYSLIGSPAGALINATNGVITWTNATPSGLAARFTTLVTDNGLPPASATNTFTVFVTPFPAITNVTVTATNTVLSWLAPTNDQFQIGWKTNLASPTWTQFLVPPITSSNGIFTFVDTNTPVLMKFYELILLP